LLPLPNFPTNLSAWWMALSCCAFVVTEITPVLL
jgi:hypothetical protein